MSVSLPRVNGDRRDSQRVIIVIRLKRSMHFGARCRPSLAPEATRSEGRHQLAFSRFSPLLPLFLSLDHFLFFKLPSSLPSPSLALCSGQSSCRESFMNFHNYVGLNTRNQIAWGSERDNCFLEIRRRRRCKARRGEERLLL